MKQTDFIYNNIKKELLDLGHPAAVADSCANSAKSIYLPGSNWKMGTVYAELSKGAKKAAGKVNKSKEKLS